MFRTKHCFEMANKLSEDYANYFLQNNIAKEVAPMISTIENIQTRVAEIEFVYLPTIRHDTEMNKESLSEILQFKESFDKICSQIDNLDCLVNRVKLDLAKLEEQMDVANDELDESSKNPLSFLRSMNPFGKPRSPLETNLSRHGTYEPIDIFRAADYFDSEKNN